MQRTTRRDAHASPGARRRVLVHAAAAAGLLLAFVVLPPLLWGGPGAGRFTHEADISAAAATDVLRQWQAGKGTSTSTLADLVGYWAGFHLLKAVIAAALAVVAVRGLLTSGGRVARAGFLAVVGAAGLALMANVQGAVAPLASLASMLPGAAPSAALTEALASMSSLLAPGVGEARPPLLESLVRDFAAYHAALAAVGAVVTAGTAALAVATWRRAWRVTAVVCATTAVALLVVVTANVSTALAPEPALASFLAAASGR